MAPTAAECERWFSVGIRKLQAAAAAVMPGFAHQAALAKAPIGFGRRSRKPLQFNGGSFAQIWAK
jgi:hypothetical protein